MREHAHPNLALFTAIFALVVAWRIAPQEGADWRIWLLAVLFAAGGTQGVIRSAVQMRRAHGPRPRPKTPPMWAVSWLIVLLLVGAFGTPHLRLIYGPQGCLYGGWNGMVRQEPYPCRLFEMIPVRW